MPSAVRSKMTYCGSVSPYSSAILRSIIMVTLLCPVSHVLAISSVFFLTPTILLVLLEKLYRYIPIWVQIMQKGTYLDLETFLEEAQRFPNKSQKLSKAHFHVLNIFSSSEYLSAYEVYLNLNKNKKIAYKNVHKVVHRLADLGLIKRLDEPKLETIKKSRKYLHKAIHYQLTLGGIFNLLSTGSLYIGNLIFDIFPQNLFLKFFLDLFFTQKTIKEIKSTIFLKMEIVKYLSSCCKITESYEMVLRTLPDDSLFYNLDFDERLVKDDSKLLLFLNDIFDFNIVDATITREENNLVNIRNGDNLVSIRAYEKKIFNNN
jgi:predicted transcriptional regulator